MSDKFIKSFLKFLNFFLWFLFFIFLIFWYGQNKDDFFPHRKIEHIPNPINPFK